MSNMMSTFIEKGEYDDNLERNTPNKREKYYLYLRHTIAINDVSQWTSWKTRKKNEFKAVDVWILWNLMNENTPGGDSIKIMKLWSVVKSNLKWEFISMFSYQYEGRTRKDSLMTKTKKIHLKKRQTSVGNRRSPWILEITFEFLHKISPAKTIISLKWTYYSFFEV